MEGKSALIFANAFMSLTGGDKHFIEVAKRGGRNGWQVKVITTKSGHSCCIKEGLKTDFAVIQNLFIDRLGLIFSYLMRTITAVIYVLRDRKYLINYSSSDSLPDIVPAVFSKVFRKSPYWVSCIFHIIPHPLNREGSFLRNLISYYAQRFAFSLIKGYSNLILVDNNILKEDLSRRGFKRENISIISMGIDKDIIDSVPQGKKVYDACFLGRLHPTKGIFDLVKIWSEVVKRHPGYRLGIIGTGSDKTEKRLHKSIKRSNLLNSIVFLGGLDTLEAYKVLKTSRIFILPSYEEGWGICIAEAMACGLPVVVYDLPVFKEIFPKGIVAIEKGNWKLFAETVIDLLNDGNRLRRLEQEGLDLVRQYNWDKVTEKEWGEINKFKD